MLFCETCAIHFTRKQVYEKHLKTQKHLKRIHSAAFFQCPCGKSYSCKQSLYVHRKKCPRAIPSTDIAFLVDKLEKVEEKNKKLQEQIDSLQTGQTIHNNNNIETQHNTNIENQNVTININAFGNENMEYLSESVIKKCIEKIYNSIPVFVEKLHFHPQHPENHNVKIKNQRQPYIKILTEDNKWKLANKNDTIESLMDKSYNILESSYEDNKKEFSEFKQRRFEEFQEKFISQDKKTISDLKRNVEMLILNGS